jgi:fucose permease
MKRNYFIVGLVFLIFFVISLLTNIQGPLLPEIISSFNINLGLAGFLPFAFFLAYGVMSIPAGMLIQRFDEKPVLLIAFISAFLGSCMFAFKPVYGIALFSLFTIGLGMAMLQVAINPLLRVAGGEENYAFFGVMAQLFFGAASWLNPYFYSYLVRHLGTTGSGPENFLLAALRKVVNPAMPWIAMYWIFTLVTLAMILVIALIKIPKVELTEEEKAGTLKTHLDLLKSKTVWLFFFGTFCYVGLEQGVSIWISKFLQIYHQVDPRLAGAIANSWFWGLQALGCILGLLLLKLFDSRRILIAFGVLAAITLTFAIFGPKTVSMIAFPIVGFWTSVMWATIFALALNSVAKHHGSFSGILCSGIMGGAIVPLLVGKLGDLFGLKIGMLVIYLTLAYIISIGFWAKPLVVNATIGSKKKKMETA